MLRTSLMLVLMTSGTRHIPEMVEDMRFEALNDRDVHGILQLMNQ